jgi:ssDNA-binding Zn-finger/Zn-ribbon topoisomerase 1
MSYHCPECDVNWWPYQTDRGHCPSCGAGTVRRQERASDDARDPVSHRP